ncbi:hypothetical protein QA596_02735 [Balneolales bacterium ANBcel1]|nr:hypothetical protein [Balneolales bacterium ANBcel1]
MKTTDMSRTRLYEKFHTFEKYHHGWYHYLHRTIRAWIRMIIPPKSKTAY